MVTVLSLLAAPVFAGGDRSVAIVIISIVGCMSFLSVY